MIIQPHGQAHSNAVHEHDFLDCWIIRHGALQILKPPARSGALQKDDKIADSEVENSLLSGHHASSQITWTSQSSFLVDFPIQ